MTTYPDRDPHASEQPNTIPNPPGYKPRQRNTAMLIPIGVAVLVFATLYFAFVLPQSSPDKARELSARGELTYQAAGCEIKAGSDKIFYLPGQVGYNKVNMTGITGARWFCSQEDAVKNGWAKASP